jgi:hypothetical protein
MERGNPIERNLAQYFNDRFPNYPIYRRSYLLPLTGLPSDPNWRFDTHPYLEQIGIASFGLLKSINFIYIKQNQIKVGDPDQTFKNVYFHFGHVADCIESLARSIVMVIDLLEIKKVNTSLKLSEETLLYDFKEWIKSKYESKYNQMIQFGKPIFHYPQQDHNYLSILTNPSQRKDYNKYMTDVKDYRNFYAHNPGVDVILEIPSRKKYVLRKEHVILAKNWATVRYLFKSNRQYFIEPETMISADLNELIALLNELWNPIMKWMDKVYINPNFNRYFKDFQRDIIVN